MKTDSELNALGHLSLKYQDNVKCHCGTPWEQMRYDGISDLGDEILEHRTCLKCGTDGRHYSFSNIISSIK